MTSAQKGGIIFMVVSITSCFGGAFLAKILPAILVQCGF